MAPSDSETFEPAPFQTISEPAQFKAFTDPLRIRIHRVLRDREATNQQIAHLLDQPQARVLHHVRALLEMELIRLVRQEISGGNVEKYYRATARMYLFRPDENEETRYASSVIAAVAEDISLTQSRMPDESVNFELRRARMSEERRADFEAKLEVLIGEYWGGPDHELWSDPNLPLHAMATVVYRSGDVGDD